MLVLPRAAPFLPPTAPAGKASLNHGNEITTPSNYTFCSYIFGCRCDRLGSGRFGPPYDHYQQV